MKRAWKDPRFKGLNLFLLTIILACVWIGEIAGVIAFSVVLALAWLFAYIFRNNP